VAERVGLGEIHDGNLDRSVSRKKVINFLRDPLCPFFTTSRFQNLTGSLSSRPWNAEGKNEKLIGAFAIRVEWLAERVSMADSQEITWIQQATVFVHEGRTVIPVLVHLCKHPNGSFDGYLMDLNRSDSVSRGHLAVMEADRRPTLSMGGRYWDLSLASGGLILSATPDGRASSMGEAVGRC
jgi:hypothetical protein